MMTTEPNNSDNNSNGTNKVVIETLLLTSDEATLRSKKPLEVISAVLSIFRSGQYNEKQQLAVWNLLPRLSDILDQPPSVPHQIEPKPKLAKTEDAPIRRMCGARRVGQAKSEPWHFGEGLTTASSHAPNIHYTLYAALRSSEYISIKEKAELIDSFIFPSTEQLKSSEEGTTLGNKEVCQP